MFIQIYTYIYRVPRRRRRGDAPGVRVSTHVSLSVFLTQASAATPTRRSCGRHWRSLGSWTLSTSFPPAALLSRNFLRHRPPRVQLLPPRRPRRWGYPPAKTMGNNHNHGRFGGAAWMPMGISCVGIVCMNVHTHTRTHTHARTHAHTHTRVCT